MRKQITEHRTCLPDRQAQSTDYRAQKNGLGSGVWGLGSKSGFTLIELMIAITITVLAMAAVYTSFIVQQRSFTTQDRVAETQVSSKIAFDKIIKIIRETGFGYPADEEPIVNSIAGTISTGDAGDSYSPDSITVVGGFRRLGTVGASVNAYQNDYIDICYETSTQFNITDRKYLSIEGIFYAEVTSTASTSITCGSSSTGKARLNLDRDVSIGFPSDRPIYLVEDVSFSIVVSNGTNCSASVGTNCLRLVDRSNTYTLAHNIDDTQFVYAVDIDDDGNIDDQNGNSVIDPGDYINNPSLALAAGATVLGIRTNLLASVSDPDQTLDPATKTYASGITLENGATIGAGDQFRRRVWSTEIALRNPR